jgi:hypothetical protein
MNAPGTVTGTPPLVHKRTRLRAVAENGLTGVAGQRHRMWMNELLVGYTRVSTEQQDLTPHSQRTSRPRRP